MRPWESLRQAAAPAVRPPSKQAPFAPAAPMPVPPSPARRADAPAQPLVVLGAYPNPFGEELTVHFYLAEKASVRFTMANTAGQTVFESEAAGLPPGLHRWPMNPAGMAPGVYLLAVTAGEARWTHTFMRE